MNIKADPTEFVGKRVLISGGSKGLGRATVDHFLGGGAEFAINGGTIRTV
jgi:NAD(P)-dependent dehydrogenase (short-subunit alcohol dehydrogenase family)